MDQALRREILDFYTAYMDAFRRADTAALATMATVPMARLTPAGPTLSQTPPDPVALRARGWHDTIDMDVEVLDVSPDRAHLHLRHAVRVRADGSPIETLRGVYVLLRGAEGWKIAAVSVVATPA